MSDISITASQVLKSASANPQRNLFIDSGVTVTQGKVIYLAASGKVGLADSNGVSPANSVLGLALTAGSPLQPVDYVSTDTALVLGAAASLTTGQVLYLSNTAGGITATYGDLASGSTVITLGVVVDGSTGTVNWNPVVGGVKP